jgi:hypothetical protein
LGGVFIDSGGCFYELWGVFLLTLGDVFVDFGGCFY